MMKSNIQYSTFNIQRRRIARLVLIGRWKLNVQRSMFPLAILSLLTAFPLRGQTTVSPTNASPQLSPPYGELPPTIWEQHGNSIAFAGLGFIALVAFGLWLFFRPKPKVVGPPEMEAREALENLRRQPEDGVIVSRVTQVVRNYFIAAFQMAPGELTTTEFRREIFGNEKVGAELSMAAIEFLRDCDARKFSTIARSTKADAANRALNLVEQAERRRSQLRQPAETQTQSPRV
jgi:hypothetical protein